VLALVVLGSSLALVLGLLEGGKLVGPLEVVDDGLVILFNCLLKIRSILNSVIFKLVTKQLQIKYYTYLSRRTQAFAWINFPGLSYVLIEV